MSNVLYQGYLGIAKKKSTSQRYFVLHEYHLDYYQTNVDFTSGVKPRGRISLNEVQSFEAVPGTDSFILRILTGEVTMVAQSQDDLAEWSTALKKALNPAEERKEEHTTATTAPSSGAEEEEEEQEEEEAKEKDKARSRQFCEGTLNVMRKGRAVSRYFVLTPDHIQYYSDSQDFTDGQAPRGFLAREQVSGVEPCSEGGFFLNLHEPDKPIELQAANLKDEKKWMAAFTDWLNGKAAWRLDAPRRQAIEKLFSTFDDNSSGHLCSTEMHTYCRYCGFDGSLDEWEQEWDGITTQCGIGISGGLTLDQFAAFVNQEANFTETEVLEAMIKELKREKASLARVKSVVQIQASFRGHKERKEQAKRSQAATKIQNIVRRRNNEKQALPRGKSGITAAMLRSKAKKEAATSSQSHPRRRPHSASPGCMAKSLMKEREKLERDRSLLEARIRVVKADEEKMQSRQASINLWVDSNQRRAQSLRREKDELRQQRVEDMTCYSARARGHVREVRERSERLKEYKHSRMAECGWSKATMASMKQNNHHHKATVFLYVRGEVESRMEADKDKIDRLSTELSELHQRVADAEAQKRAVTLRERSVPSYAPPFR